jgi:hypothetical protein
MDTSFELSDDSSGRQSPPDPRSATPPPAGEVPVAQGFPVWLFQYSRQSRNLATPRDADDLGLEYEGMEYTGLPVEFVMFKALTCFATLRLLPPWESYGNHRDRADELAAGPRRASYEHAWDKISFIASWPVGVSAKNFFRP